VPTQYPLLAPPAVNTYLTQISYNKKHVYAKYNQQDAA